MNNQTLAVSSLGMVSCLTNTAESNAAAMRCNYDGFTTLDFNEPHRLEKPQIGASSVIAKNIKSTYRIAKMLETVVEESLSNIESRQPIPALICMQSKLRPNILIADDYLPYWIKMILNKNICDRYNLEVNYAYQDDRTSIVKGIYRAGEYLYKEDNQYALILLVDSFISFRVISFYSGDMYGEGRRVFGDDFSNGFIPGEAAVAILVSKPEPGKEQTLITGTGHGIEEAVVGSDEVLRAKGLTEAVRNACSDAGIRVCDTDFRISSLNGEEYWFSETSLVASRVLEEKKESWPLWHPADNIGEVGAAVGGAMVVMAHFGFKKNYAPGKRALCQISNDDQHRAAFVIERSIPE